MEGSSSIAQGGRQSPPAHAPAAVIAALVAGAWASLAEGLASLEKAAQRARARRELHRLSDHYLKDIGLHRSQIDRMFS